MTIELVAFLASVASALMLTPASMRFGYRFGLTDAPDARKVHRIPVPRVGGLAIVIAFVTGASPLLASTALAGRPVFAAAALVACAAAVFAVGLVDDARGLPGQWKLLALVGAGAVLCAAGVRIDHVGLGNTTPVSLGWWAWPVTIVWLATVTVGVNFIDGLDGLAAGVVAIAASALAAVAAYRGESAVVGLSLALVGSALGFLYFNAHPARLFMGDGGSMFLGFTLAGLVVLSGHRSANSPDLGGAALLLGVPLLDCASTMVRRALLLRQPIFAAERGHVHHRLLARGLAHGDAVRVVYVICLVAATASVLLLLPKDDTTVTLLWSAGALAVVGFFVAVGAIQVRATARSIRGLASALRQSRHLGSDDARIVAPRTSHAVTGWTMSGGAR